MKKSSKSVLAWYFAPADKYLAHGDGRLIKVSVTHKVTGQPVLCQHGLHASIRLIDALQYAGSSTIFRVRMSGKVVYGRDKLVGLSRTYLAELDATVVLEQFARKCALDVLHLWDAPEVVKEWLETGNPALRKKTTDAAAAAAAAAGAVADAAAYTSEAACAAASVAAYAAEAARAATYVADAADGAVTYTADVARAATEAARAAYTTEAARAAADVADGAAADAADDVARVATRVADGAAARATTRRKQNKWLTAMVLKAIKG